MLKHSSNWSKGQVSHSLTSLLWVRVLPVNRCAPVPLKGPFEFAASRCIALSYINSLDSDHMGSIEVVERGAEFSGRKRTREWVTYWISCFLHVFSHQTCPPAFSFWLDSKLLCLNVKMCARMSDRAELSGVRARTRLSSIQHGAPGTVMLASNNMQRFARKNAQFKKKKYPTNL